MDNVHYLNLPRAEALGRTDPYRDSDDGNTRGSSPRGIFDGLIPIVGDIVALETLDTYPLPDEPFDWSAVASEDHALVAEVLARSDMCCDELLDVEFRTITRRILARVARRDPRCLRRATKADRVAAALVYLAGRANGEFGRRGRLTAHSLWSWWATSSCADRARTLQSAAGLEPEHISWTSIGFEELTLGDAALLHSSYRKQICRRRDYLAAYAPRPRVMPLPDGRRAEVRAEPAKAVAAAKGLVGARVYMILGLGDTLDDATFFALSVPEARELVSIVQNALDAPAPRADSS